MILDFKIISDYIKTYQLTPFTANLIDMNTAFGFCRPLRHDKFINESLIPWIEMKPNICTGIKQWMLFKVPFED